MTTKYQSNGEATRAIKGALRKAFPTAKISITHGGSRIEWTDDGPTVEQVQDTILATNCAESELNWRDEPRLKVSGGSIHCIRYNVAEREAYQVDLERRVGEREQQRQRENKAAPLELEAAQ